MTMAFLPWPASICTKHEHQHCCCHGSPIFGVFSASSAANRTSLAETNCSGRRALRMSVVPVSKS